jgi:PQQ enzyme repeat.
MPGPVLADGIAFVGSGDRAYAVDALTGKRLWNAEMGSLTHYFSPTIADGQVFLVPSQTSPQAVMLAD